MEIERKEENKDVFKICIKSESFKDGKFITVRKDFLKRTLLKCECGSPEHILLVTEIDDDESDLYIEVHLDGGCSVFRRVWRAIKYIFNYRGNYGDYDEVILSDESKVKLMEILAKNLIKGQEIRDKYEKEHGAKI